MAELKPSVDMLEKSAIDSTRAFHIFLYILALEGFLFFAVVTQTKSQEPGAHGGISRSFGLMFLFQSVAALFLVISSQLFPGVISLYASVISTGSMILVAAMCIPASASICFPEARRRSLKTVAVIAFLSIVLICSFFLGPYMEASPDIPFIPLGFRKQVLGSIIGGLLSVVISCGFRMIRNLKGRNGAFVLVLGCSLILAAGFIWSKLEPRCDASDVKNWNCPMPRAFDHNSLFTVLLAVGNILGAEGVLRLMAAGNGSEGYVEIIP
eukprot:CAMPEP_0184692286 /NCGR_PEP_ID=MMETSP0313-20130426/835_1 /TAXON_ID=2792 /ORGANISM="Porphyridium aerugineum, Strain SAG 1380-2" /LENGTH=267 /DNA_ID=CAMNT_0027150111 /DNA_START=184 /DNA_END=987 /DNA_ORIENTATION=+